MLLFLLTMSVEAAYPETGESTLKVSVVQQGTTCKGVVKDAAGETIIGASVVAKGTTNGTITGINGDFSLNNVKTGDIIVVSFVGYQTQEIKFTGQSLNIILKDNTQTLDEVVVVAFGTQKKVNVTGSVSTVGAKEISARPVNSTIEALQGMVPGMNISTGDGGGSLGSDKKFNIRGVGTIGAGSKVEPLVLIDGMEGDMNAINPQDIENISVLKAEQAMAEADVARLQVQQAKSRLQRAETNFSYTTITAPFEGYVDRIPFKVGSLVTPSSLLTSLTDVSDMFAYFKINEKEYLEYKRTQLSGIDQPEYNNLELILSDQSTYRYKGKVETVEGDFERGTGSIAFRARFANPERLLRHGVSGKIRMLTKMENVVLVPQQSTFDSRFLFNALFPIS